MEKFSSILNDAQSNVEVMIQVFSKKTFNFINLLRKIFEKIEMDIILTSLLNPEDSLINDNNLNNTRTLKF
jgi:hypothetical protein